MNPGYDLTRRPVNEQIPPTSVPRRGEVERGAARWETARRPGLELGLTDERELQWLGHIDGQHLVP